jgi:hypothetical protein
VTTINTPSGFLTTNAGMGMAISGATGTLYVSHDDPATGTMMSLYTRDLTTGAETLIGAYPSGTFIHEIAVFVPVPEPTLVLSMAGLIGVLLAAHRRKETPARPEIVLDYGMFTRNFREVGTMTPVGGDGYGGRPLWPDPVPIPAHEMLHFIFKH